MSWFNKFDSSRGIRLNENATKQDIKQATYDKTYTQFKGMGADSNMADSLATAEANHPGSTAAIGKMIIGLFIPSWFPFVASFVGGIFIYLIIPAHVYDNYVSALKLSGWYSLAGYLVYLIIVFLFAHKLVSNFISMFSGYLFSAMWLFIGSLFWPANGSEFKWAMLVISFCFAIWGLSTARGTYLAEKYSIKEDIESEHNEKIERAAREKKRKEYLKVSKAKIEDKRKAGTLGEY